MIPSAILYDLANGGDKNWAEKPTYSSLGSEAISNLSDNIELGNVGAGYGSIA